MLEKEFSQIDLRNAAFGGETGEGEIFKGVGKDAVDELTQFKIIGLRRKGTAFSGKTEIDQLFNLNDCLSVIKSGGVETAVKGFKNFLYFFGAFGEGGHLTVGKSFQKSVVDASTAFAAKIDPDMAIGSGISAVIKTVKAVAVTGADDNGGLQMQEGVVKFQINGAGTDHFKRKCIRCEMTRGMDVTAVKGAVFGVGDEQVIKIMNGIQNFLL